MKINGRYLAAFLVLVAAEVLIALFVHDAFVRPYLGDVLIVLVLYCFARVFIGPRRWLPWAVLAFCVAVEISQYFKLVERLGLAGNRLAAALMGTTFAWADLGCYLVGFLLLILWQWRAGVPPVQKWRA